MGVNRGGTSEEEEVVVIHHKLRIYSLDLCICYPYFELQCTVIVHNRFPQENMHIHIRMHVCVVKTNMCPLLCVVSILTIKSLFFLCKIT